MVVVYKCNKCNKIYGHKNDFQKHKNRKNPCNTELINNIDTIDSHKNLSIDTEEDIEKLHIDENKQLEDIPKKMQIKYTKTSIYKFNTRTFGKSMYPNDKNSGDIFIIQTEFNIENLYKIGTTMDIYYILKSYKVWFQN